jgi:hypothetical protein
MTFYVNPSWACALFRNNKQHVVLGQKRKCQRVEESGLWRIQRERGIEVQFKENISWLLNENENEDCITWRLLWHNISGIFTRPQPILQNPTSFKCPGANRLKGQICKKPPFFRVLWDFSCNFQSLYYLPDENIVFNDKICWLIDWFMA